LTKTQCFISRLNYIAIMSFGV